jgi:hypothetical protein
MNGFRKRSRQVKTSRQDGLPSVFRPSACRAAGADASTLRSALRVTEANGVASARAMDTAIATISAAVKLSGGSVSVLSST